VPSALTPTGSTHQWRQLRAPFTHHLATVGPLPCRRCGQPITATDRWHLGHPDDQPRALGGEDLDLWPEHQACSIRAGHDVRREVARRRRTAATQPSREW